MAEETSDDNAVVCPHCGYEHGDAWEFSEGEHNCDKCGGDFEMRRETYVTYYARPVDPKATPNAR